MEQGYSVLARARAENEDRLERNRNSLIGSRVSPEPSQSALDDLFATIAESFVGTSYYHSESVPSSEGGLGLDCSGLAWISGQRASGIEISRRSANVMINDPNLLRPGHGQLGSLNLYDDVGDGSFDHVTVVGHDGMEIHLSSNNGTINLVEQGYLDPCFSKKLIWNTTGLLLGGTR